MCNLEYILRRLEVSIVKELKAREYKRFEDIKQIRVDGTEF